MIFSLASHSCDFIPVNQPDTDIFCFFSHPASVSIPDEIWFQSICTSLRLKRSVLILEKNLKSFPVPNLRHRWEVGENWCWLSPRSLSVISRAYEESSMSYSEFKHFLTKHK